MILTRLVWTCPYCGKIEIAESAETTVEMMEALIESHEWQACG
jgi:hypothetical protein